jgi:hypothetical protein
MFTDLDTFLAAVYTFVDEAYTSFCAPHKPARPGPKPSMTDSEVITLAVLSQWELRNSIDSMLTYARLHWTCYFKKILSQSAFNKRLFDLSGAMCFIVPVISENLQKYLSLHSTHEIIDGVAVPIIKCFRGHLKKTLAGVANFGIGGSDKKMYYGFKIVSTINSNGLITGFTIGSASTSELWLAECMFRFRKYPNAALPTPENMEKILGKPKDRKKRTGINGAINISGIGKRNDLPIIGDLLYKAESWRKHWKKEYEVELLTREIYENSGENKSKLNKFISRLRQQIETSFNWIKHEFGLYFCKARSLSGFIARIGAKMIGYNIVVGMNHERRVGKFEITELNPIKLARSEK